MKIQLTKKEADVLRYWLEYADSAQAQQVDDAYYYAKDNAKLIEELGTYHMRQDDLSDLRQRRQEHYAIKRIIQKLVAQ